MVKHTKQRNAINRSRVSKTHNNKLSSTNRVNGIKIRGKQVGKEILDSPKSSTLTDIGKQNKQYTSNLRNSTCENYIKNCKPDALLLKYVRVRDLTENLCRNLVTEDYNLQPIVETSPVKWNLAHTSWFFETFVLTPYSPKYKVYNQNYSYLFNSYYNAIGNRTKRNERSLQSRPTVDEVYQYRQYVNQAMITFMKSTKLNQAQQDTIELGLQHEQQHQELLQTDLKYSLFLNISYPKVLDISENKSVKCVNKWISMNEGIYNIGHEGTGFCFDNELGRHKVYLHAYEINSDLVSNRQYLNFIKAGGYGNSQFWHSDGWDWVQQHEKQHPLYWVQKDGKWLVYTLNGLEPLQLDAPVTHVNFYEAYAYAEWAGMRLPTEFEWEAAASKFKWGSGWEWTNSAYLPYPNYKKPPGAVGEYNGKFMINQMVLRGSSIATSPGHERVTYRNFFHPHLEWQFTAIRLARS